jgi:glyoxylase-like metal-dependent hydrolase (beta-lactamase superfamily II)
MKLGDPIDERIPWVRRVHALDEARAFTVAGPKLDAVRRAAIHLGDALRADAKVASLRTLPITTLLYPTAFAFNRAVPLSMPFVVMSHRCLFVQVEVEGERKNILFNPTDHQASRATPYFARMIESIGERAASFITTEFDPIERQLGALGVAPEDIDLVAFDHFHTQDVRSLFGSSEPRPDGSDFPARFPNAFLLAPKVEWNDWDSLHPMQTAWFVHEGKRGVPMERVVLTEDDLWLGPGCLLLRTPGHTTGNQTLFVSTDHGVFGCSENGTSADNWAPYESRIPGMRNYVWRYDAEVVINSNTPELGAEQYTSMILERSLVDRVKDRPAFVQMFPSSEVTPSLLSPGIKPAMIFGKIESGLVRG